MRILAIDTALPAVSACVLDSEAEEPISLETQAMDRGHAEALVPMIERVMRKVEGGFQSIDRVAVAVGPGSFTGIRIGLAAGQAIALACKAEIVGVSTLAAIATPFILQPFEGVLAAAIDAHHGKLYVAAFGSDGRAIITPRRLDVLEALRALGAGPLTLIGSGAPMLAAEAKIRGVPAIIASEQAAADIVFIARLGLAAHPETAPARPLYLKEPDYKTIGAPPAAVQAPSPEAAESARDAAPMDALPPTAMQEPGSDTVPHDAAPAEV